MDEGNHPSITHHDTILLSSWLCPTIYSIETIFFLRWQLLSVPLCFILLQSRRFHAFSPSAAAPPLSTRALGIEAAQTEKLPWRDGARIASGGPSAPAFRSRRRCHRRVEQRGGWSYGRGPPSLSCRHWPGVSSSRRCLLLLYLLNPKSYFKFVSKVDLTRLPDDDLVTRLLWQKKKKKKTSEICYDTGIDCFAYKDGSF